MCGKLTYLVSVVLVLGGVCNALADDLIWDNSSGDSLWKNPENWDLNKVPGENDAVYIDWLREPTEVIIDADTEALFNSVTISNDSVGGQDYVHLHMTGGTLIAGNLIRIGREQLGMFTIDDGEVTCSAFQLGRKDPSKGVVYINGGTVTVSTNVRVPRGGSQGSELHLNGGVLYTNGLVMNDPDDELSGTNGSMDITGGVMVLTSEEDQTGKIKEYVQNGWITAYGVNSGELLEDGRLALVQMDYDVTNPGMTTVWAIVKNPVQARSPQPKDGAVLVINDATSLNWTAGETAVRHDLYFGTSFEDVNAADITDTTGIYVGSQDVSGYIFPEALEWGATYYWRVDEIEADSNLHRGSVWSLTVADYLLVDDFESYTDLCAGLDDCNRIYLAWVDGFDNPENGSIVGYENPPFTEQIIVHGGGQSMPFFYDNSGSANYSEASKKLIYLRDWTEYDVEILSLWFRGHSLYVGGFTESPAGTYTMTASGVDIWNTSDEFHFAYKEQSGAVAITARVESVGDTDPWAKAGVMIRDTLTADSRHAMMAVTPGNGVWFGQREATGGGSFSTRQEGITAPQWVKLERTIGGLVRAYYSADGTTWTQLGTASVMMDMPVYIGLALTSHNADATCEAVFSNVSYPDTDVGPEWIDQDVGIIGNEPEPMYVTVSNSNGISANVVHPEPNAALIEDWTEWTIDLKDFSDASVNLTDINSISIGLGDKAGSQNSGSGTLFFDDIRLYRPAPEPEEIINIQWLGHSTVKVWDEDCIVYIDPERVNESLHDATLVCVTHTHSDHYSPSDIAKVSNSQTQFIGPPDVVQQYGSGLEIAPGQTIKFDNASIIAVAAYNTNKPNHPKSMNWVGYIIEIGSKRIYVAGDTDIIDEMKTLGKIDVAILPAGGTYTMNAVEAAEATQYIKPELAIPYHWGQSVGNLSDAQTFAELARCAVKILAVGETISSDNWPEYSPLLARWRLDEADGIIADDDVGENDGILYGEPLWQPAGGKLDGALELDGLDDYVETGFVLSPADGVFSVFAWIKGGSPGQVIISQTDGGGKGDTWLGFESTEGKLMSSLVPPPAGRAVPQPLVSEVITTDGNWHHIGFVWDGSYRSLFIDGVEAAQDDQSLNPLNAADGGLHIGAGKILEERTFFSGMIDDVRIYNQALNAEEITNMSE
jgi:L-ascorbate metabolism protein UlaG (beta-lactamase superfamily)